jgi:Concanavalin A-like lectin/glucanases superfamily/Alpha-L-arabinofuranosidase C-terminal domain
MFNFLDDNNWTWLNIGGWNNTLDGIEQTVGGNKSLISSQVPQNIATNTWYNISIVLSPANILCYLNGSLIQSAPNPAGLYASSTYNKSSGQIIVKAVNAYNAPVVTAFNVAGAGSVSPNATLIQLISANATDENSLASPTHVFPVTNLIANAGTNFTVTLPANSLSVLRLSPAGIVSYTNLQLQFASPISTGQQTACTVLGRQSGNWINLTANANHAITYASADTNIAIVDSYGNVTGVGSGTTSIIASYASLGLSAAQALEVVDVPTALVHRYSFNDGTANDSIGGANGTLMGNARISGGQLVLPNATSAAPATDYLQLPAGILANSVNGTNNDPAVTVEAWASFNSGQYTWANLFDFGNRDAGSFAEYDIHLCVHANDNSTIAGISDSDNANVDYQFIDLGSGTILDGETNVHVVVVFNPPAGYEAVYLNGVLAGANDNVTIPMSGVQAIRNIVGADNWPDPGMQGSIDELRIYNGALTPNEIAATDALGPNQLLTVASPVITVSPMTNGVLLSWPAAAAGFSLQSTTNPASAWTTMSFSPQLVGGQWQVNVPASESAQFFRLAQ